MPRKETLASGKIDRQVTVDLMKIGEFTKMDSMDRSNFQLIVSCSYSDGNCSLDSTKIYLLMKRKIYQILIIQLFKLVKLVNNFRSFFLSLSLFLPLSLSLGLSNVLYPNVLARSRIWILIEQRRQRRRRTFIDSNRSPDDSAIRSHIQSGGPCILIPLLRSTRYPEVICIRRTAKWIMQNPEDPIRSLSLCIDISLSPLAFLFSRVRSFLLT